MDLSRLNKEQNEAVLHGDSPLLVLAGAGTGKTTAVTFRIANMIQTRGISSNKILAMTFTNKAAREMKERLELLLAKKLANNQFGKPWNTLSSLDQRQLRNKIYMQISKDLWIF